MADSPSMPAVRRLGLPPQRTVGSVLAAFALAVATCAPSASTSPAGQTSPQPSTSPATLTPSAPSPTPSATEAMDPEGKTVVWATYRSDALGISFEYPRSSTTHPSLPQCVPRESGFSINVDRLIIGRAESVLGPGTGATPDAVADVFLKDLRVESRGATTMENRPGVVVGYRYGGLNRFGYALFVANGAHIYQFSWDAGVFDCEPAPGFIGPAVYLDMIRSVRFLT